MNRGVPQDPRGERGPVTSPTVTRELLTRYLAGDHDAERRLFDRFRASLLRRASGHRLMRPIAGRVSAEDIVQEVFWRALSSGMLQDFDDRGRGSLAAALNVVLDRTLVDVGRRLSAAKREGDRTARSLDEIGDGAMIDDTRLSSRDPTPTSHAREDELVKACRDTLGEREWETWELVELSGWTCEDAARHLGQTAAAVRGVLFRARAKLLRALAHENPNAPRSDRVAD